jgi:hypothetical protein
MRFEIAHELAEARARHAVDEAVMRLGEHRNPAALETLDVPHLPQRKAPVELVAEEHAAELTELPHAAGRWNTDAVEVVLDIEIQILDQEGPIQTEGYLAQPHRESGCPADPLCGVPLELLEGEVLAATRIQNRQAAGVGVDPRVLHGHEEGVSAR